MESMNALPPFASSDASPGHAPGVRERFPVPLRFALGHMVSSLGVFLLVCSWPGGWAVVSVALLLVGALLLSAPVLGMLDIAPNLSALKRAFPYLFLTFLSLLGSYFSAFLGATVLRDPLFVVPGLFIAVGLYGAFLLLGLLPYLRLPESAVSVPVLSPLFSGVLAEIYADIFCEVEDTPPGESAPTDLRPAERSLPENGIDVELHDEMDELLKRLSEADPGTEGGNPPTIPRPAPRPPSPENPPLPVPEPPRESPGETDVITCRSITNLDGMVMAHLDVERGRFHVLKDRGGRDVEVCFQCPSCGEEVSPSVRVCPSCGLALSSARDVGVYLDDIEDTPFFSERKVMFLKFDVSSGRGTVYRRAARRSLSMASAGKPSLEIVR